MKGVMTGRFQPYHSGHEEAVEEMEESGIEEIYIGIVDFGKRTPTDPFTYEERKEIIEISENSKINCFRFPVRLPWTLYTMYKIVRNYSRDDAVYWSGDWTNIFMAKLCGFKTYKRKRTGPSASEIRKIIADMVKNYKTIDGRIKEELEDFMPKESLEVLQKILYKPEVKDVFLNMQ